MSRAKKTTQVALRIDDTVLADAEKLALKLSQPGLKLTRTDILRMAMMSGLADLRLRHSKAA